MLIESQMEALGLLGVTERIEAVANPNGHLGCTRSHIKALQYAYEHANWGWVAILEDDFDWTGAPAAVNASLERVMSQTPSFDVFLLAFSCPDEPPVLDEHTQLYQVSKAHTTAGYIIRREFIPVLLRVFQRGECAMRYGGSSMVYTVDQSWVPLQRSSRRFFTTVPALGHQRSDFSDIEQQFYVDRGC